MFCREMGCMTGKIALGIFLVNMSARMVPTRETLGSTRRGKMGDTIFATPTPPHRARGPVKMVPLPV